MLLNNYTFVMLSFHRQIRLILNRDLTNFFPKYDHHLQTNYQPICWKKRKKQAERTDLCINFSEQLNKMK
jgi:hypothetical protein